jgi:hypothetical protein
MGKVGCGGKIDTRKVKVIATHPNLLRLQLDCPRLVSTWRCATKPGGVPALDPANPEHKAILICKRPAALSRPTLRMFHRVEQAANAAGLLK